MQLPARICCGDTAAGSGRSPGKKDREDFLEAGLVAGTVPLPITQAAHHPVWPELKSIGIDIVRDRRKAFVGELGVLQVDPHPPAGIVGGLDRDPVMMLARPVTMGGEPVLPAREGDFRPFVLCCGGITPGSPGFDDEQNSIKQGSRSHFRAFGVFMKVILSLIGVVLLVVAAVYFLVPADQLPTFLPGHEAGLARIRMKHGVVAGVVGIVCLVLSMVLRRR
jgi:hypothetical protein